ncbi:HNH endonuclease [Vibrio phage 12VC501]|nr:HNH endonuclease [Vibrio phage 12VC501]
MNENTIDAIAIMEAGSEAMKERASSRDVQSERSMKATVAAFNAMYGTNLTEEMGWMFQVFLKASRAKGGEVRIDDYIDGAAYFALAGECAQQERK